MANTATTRQLLDNLTYDTEVYTADGVDAAISNALTGGYKVKGTKTVAQLNTLAPSVAGADSTLAVGQVFNVSDGGTLAAAATNADASVAAGDNVVWTEDGWDRLTGVVDMTGKQDKITASGLLKGNGSGGVSAAVAGTDYVAPSAIVKANEETPSDKQNTVPSLGLLDAILAGFVSQAGITGEENGPISVTSSGNSDATISHAKNGPSNSASTSKGDTSNQTPGFGGTFKALSATVDKYGHTTALAEHTVTIPSDTAVATGQTGAKNGLMSADDKAKLNGVATGAQANVIEGVKIDGASSNLTPSSKVVTIPSGTTSAKGVVQLSDSTSSTSTSLAATANAVKAAYDRGSAGVTAAGAEKTKRNAVATALSTYNALTQSSSQSDTRALINALLAALKAFGADAS